MCCQWRKRRVWARAQARARAVVTGGRAAIRACSMRSLVSRIGWPRGGIQFVWAATRVEGFRAATVKEAPRGCARRSSPACEPRAAALAVAPFARLELASEGRASGRHTGQPGMPSEKVAVSPFFSSRPVSRVQSRVVRQCFSNRGNAINSLRTCKRALSGDYDLKG